MSLAERVQQRMDALNLNPYRAAINAGLGSSYVRDILRGRVQCPSAANLAVLASALDTTANYLLSGEGKPEASGLATRIQQRLDALGLTARAASLEADGGPDLIRTILDGRSSDPRASTMLALSRVLECDLIWLIEGTGTPTRNPLFNPAPNKRDQSVPAYMREEDVRRIVQEELGRRNYPTVSESSSSCAPASPTTSPGNDYRRARPSDVHGSKSKSDRSSERV